MKAVQTKQQNEESSTQAVEKKKKKLFRISDIYSKSKGKKKGVKKKKGDSVEISIFQKRDDKKQKKKNRTLAIPVDNFW